MTTASLTRRLASMVYECLLLAAILLTTAAVFTPLLSWGNHAAPLEMLYRLSMAGILFGYFGYCWTRSGQTPAMKTWRIAVVAAHGGRLDWRLSAWRFAAAMLLYVAVPVVSFLAWQRATGDSRLAGWLSLAWWLMPTLWVMFDPDRQFLHDRLAGTRLVQLAKGERL